MNTRSSVSLMLGGERGYMGAVIMIVTIIVIIIVIAAVSETWVARSLRL